MQRAATKQSRAANKLERDFMAWVKQQPCCVCNRPGPSIVDHIFGSSKKSYAGLERVHIGHIAILSLCEYCDSVKTRGSRREFESRFGRQLDHWYHMITQSEWFGRFSEIEIRAVLEAR